MNQVLTILSVLFRKMDKEQSSIEKTIKKRLNELYTERKATVAQRDTAEQKIIILNAKKEELANVLDMMSNTYKPNALTPSRHEEEPQKKV